MEEMKVTRRLFEKVGAAGVIAPLAVLLGVLLGGAFLHRELSAEAVYLGALLSVLGSAACLGCHFLLVLRPNGGGFGTFSPVHGPDRSPALAPGPGVGEAWPLLVSLLFSPVCVLFAGLAGWVKVRA